MTARPAVLLLCDLAAAARERLAGRAELVQAATVSELPSTVLCGVVAVVVRSQASLDARDLRRLPALRLVVRPGSGTDNIDLPALAACGVELVRNPELGAAGVAQVCRAALELLVRKVPLAHNSAFHAEHVPKTRLLGEHPGSLRVAVWGAGPVGRACASELRGHVQEVAFVSHPSLRDGDPVVEPREAMATADAHVMTLPLRKETRGLVSADWLEAASVPAPYLLNMARTEIVDLDALAAACRRDSLRGVFVEPVDGQHVSAVAQLLGARPARNVLVSQHAGGQRADLRHRLDAWAAETLLERLDLR